MNQVFSFKRYWWLVKRQWYENAATFKWGIVLMALVTGLVFWLSSDWKTVGKFLENNPVNKMHVLYPSLGQTSTFAIIAIFFLYIYGAYFFENLSSKNKKMFYFSLPVTPLERVAMAFTFVMVLMPVLILIVFNGFDFVAVLIFNHIHGTSESMFFKKASLIGTTRLFFSLLISYLSYTSIFTLGSLIFGKKGLIISLIILISFVFIWHWLVFFIYGTSPNIMDFIKSRIYFLLFPICWLMMYFIMKRKEA